jgi:hypothetical protein
MSSFKETTEGKPLRVFAIAFALVFASSVLTPAEPAAGATPAPDAGCQEAVLNANEKLFTTPFHMYSTQSGAQSEKGKAVSTEMVFTGTARYVFYEGNWKPSPLSTDELKAMEQRNLKNTKVISCERLRDEPVEGEGAVIYKMRSQTPRSVNDDQVWVSKSKGLILRQETDLTPTNPSRKMHLSLRYEYTNVQAPKL